MKTDVPACPSCLRRARLLAALGRHLDHRRYDRHRLTALLALPERELLASAGVHDPESLRPALGDEGDPEVVQGEPEAADAQPTRARICRHAAGYPASLTATGNEPAVLHLAGERLRVAELLGAPCVAVVGTRRASDYGLEVARALGRALSAAGLTVVSGMAHGIDSAAHEGALEAGANTLAVLPGGCDRAYPAGRGALHRRLLERAGAVSELPFGCLPRRWCFIARNRIIAGLSELTIVVEAAERSGALVTAGLTQDLGRDVAAVPGRVTSPSAAGTNALLKDGAALVRDGEDVLDLLFGAGGRPSAPATRTTVRSSVASPQARLAAPQLLPGLAEPTPEELPRALRALYDEIALGRDTLESLTAAGLDVDTVLAGVTELELRGLVRTGLGGRYVARTPAHRRARPP